ncbi:hypothetical protein [Streptomyces sp. TRM49041]|uniref:hypothetical protein n=1 Tax=Streptomyces sp. TRM49041 TaxID=2603216 RepID=UPI0021CD00E7|nr:hypothetical protein [Streptomyces sp. TRM49041]
MAALRRTGDAFGSDDGRRLVAGGVARGRRRVVRRRVGVVTGGVLGLALVSVGGVYAAGALGGGAGGGGDRGNGGSSVAAPDGPRPSTSVPPAGDIGADRLIATFRKVVPRGELTDAVARGTADERGPMISGVLDDGQGRAAVGLGFYRTAPNSVGTTECPDKVINTYDDCTVEKLPGGAQLMIYQGYEYPDRREPTKLWRATYYKNGIVTDLSAWNAPAEKGAPVSRTDPPFTPAEMKRIVTAEEWRPVAAAVPDPSGAWQNDGDPADPGQPGAGTGRDGFDGAAVRPTFMSLLPKGLEVTAEGGDGEYAYAVVDDGEGGSLVEVNAQPDMSDVESQLFPEGSYTTLPDGTKVAVHKRRGDKPGEVWWNVDTMRPGGYRVVVSGWNKATAHGDPNRAEPALGMEQLKAIAISEKWLKLKQ